MYKRQVIDYATMPRVPFYVTFDKEHYQKEMAELSVDDFYNHIAKDKVFPKTSCPTIKMCIRDRYGSVPH